MSKKQEVIRELSMEKRSCLLVGSILVVVGIIPVAYLNSTTSAIPVVASPVFFRR
jgi:hypothetical protein